MQTESSLQDKMFSLISDWEHSGMSQKGFCRLHSIRYGTFHYWHKKYRLSLTTVAGFAEISSLSSVGTWFAECHFPGGGRVVFHQPVSTEFLKLLMR